MFKLELPYNIISPREYSDKYYSKRTYEIACRMGVIISIDDDVKFKGELTFNLSINDYVVTIRSLRFSTHKNKTPHLNIIFKKEFLANKKINDSLLKNNIEQLADEIFHIPDEEKAVAALPKYKISITHDIMPRNIANKYKLEEFSTDNTLELKVTEGGVLKHHVELSINGFDRGSETLANIHRTVHVEASVIDQFVMKYKLERKAAPLLEKTILANQAGYVVKELFNIYEREYL